MVIHGKVQFPSHCPCVIDCLWWVGRDQPEWTNVLFTMERLSKKASSLWDNAIEIWGFPLQVHSSEVPFSPLTWPWLCIPIHPFISFYIMFTLLVILHLLSTLPIGPQVPSAHVSVITWRLSTEPGTHKVLSVYLWVKELQLYKNIIWVRLWA